MNKAGRSWEIRCKISSPDNGMAMLNKTTCKAQTIRTGKPYPHIRGLITTKDLKEYPYEVYHAEALGPTPKFKTWEEARSMQVEWNKDVPGHRARKRAENFLEVL